MPPKIKFTKEEIAKAALAFTRENGIAALTARALAAKLGCSVKPIFGLFQSMEEVKKAVHVQANLLYQSYLQTDMAEGRYPPYKASGMAYIRFAKEETALFKLLFMRDRSAEEIADTREEIEELLNIISKNTGMSREEAYLFHIEMWVLAHGIATMQATAYLDWDEAMVSRVMTDVYEGVRMRFQSKEEEST